MMWYFLAGVAVTVVIVVILLAIWLGKIFRW